MAIYHLHVTPISRGKGQSVVAKAAYNARQKLHDEREGKTCDFSHKDEVLFSGIFAPENAPDWARDRAALWNAVEEIETGKKSQLALEIEVALPHEFTDQQREWLVKDFVREEFLRKGLVADVNIHPPPREPEREGDKPNYHAHILVGLRGIGPDGFGERALNSGSLEENAQQVEHWRGQWENLVNRHLERHGFEERIDRRTLEEQGIEREATEHRGPAADAMKRKGIETERGREMHEAEAVQTASQEHNSDRATEWWQRIEDAIERGGGYEEARREGWLSQPYGPDELDRLREFRSEVLGMRQENAKELDDGSLSKEDRAALREIAGELRDLHHATTKQIATLALEQSAYEPAIIEMGRARLGDFAQTIEGIGGKAADLVGGLADFAAKAVDAIVDFFIAPSLPTPEVINAQREAREEAAAGAFDAKRWKTDDAYRDQIDRQDRERRRQEAEREYQEQARHERGLDGRERWER